MCNWCQAEQLAIYRMPITEGQRRHLLQLDPDKIEGFSRSELPDYRVLSGEICTTQNLLAVCTKICEKL